MNSKRLAAAVAAGIIGGALVLTACSNEDSTQGQVASSAAGNHQGLGANTTTATTGGHDDSMMEHPMDGGPAPEGITPAASPKFPVGTEVTLTAAHMGGMNGAKARIVGAYTTYTYSVNYTPTTGGQRMTDHKWVVQQEIQNAGDTRLADGTQVTLLADHTTGMKGANATIASSTNETVYMVDYQSGGMTMTNHKWVVESEIEPAA